MLWRMIMNFLILKSHTSVQYKMGRIWTLLGQRFPGKQLSVVENKPPRLRAGSGDGI